MICAITVPFMPCPGLLFYLPLLDVCHKVDVRLKMLKVPPHTVENTQITYLQSSQYTV